MNNLNWISVKWCLLHSNSNSNIHMYVCMTCKQCTVNINWVYSFELLFLLFIQCFLRCTLIIIYSHLFFCWRLIFQCNAPSKTFFSSSSLNKTLYLIYTDLYKKACDLLCGFALLFENISWLPEFLSNDNIILPNWIR